MEHVEKWSGRLDLNQRPPVPETGALPDCATSRRVTNFLPVSDFRIIFRNRKKMFYHNRVELCTRTAPQLGNRFRLREGIPL